MVGPMAPGAPQGLLVFDGAGKSVTHFVSAAAAAQFPDGRFVVMETETAGPVPPDASVFPLLEGRDDRRVTGLSIWDPGDGSRMPLVDCDVLLSESERFAPVPTGDCGNGVPVFGAHRRGQVSLAVSPDGSKVAASSDRQAVRPVPSVADCGHPDLGTRQTWIWDAEVGSVLATITHDECWDLLAMGDDYLMMTSLFGVGGAVFDFDGNEIARPEFSPNPTLELTADGRHVVTHGETFGTIVVYSTDDWSEVARWQADETLVRGLALSPDQTLLVTTSEDSVGVWDIGGILAGDPELRPELVDQIPVVASDAIWLDDTTLGLAVAEGRWTTVSLDGGVVVDEILARASRSFTPEECSDYRIDPCPTIEELEGK